MPELQELLLRFIRGGYVGVMVGAFVLFLLWEGGKPRHMIPSRPRHLTRNFSLWVVMMLFADGLVGGVLLGVPFQLTSPRTGILSPLALPLLAQIVVGVVAIDLASYALHRLSHRVRPLWLVHAVHHTDAHLDFSTSMRFHPFDIACYVIVTAGTLAVLGFPLWIGGVHSLAVPPLFMAQHANVNFPRAVERWFAWLIVTPAVHRVHHSADRPGIDANYGQMFSIWDRLFGSYVAPAAGDPPRIGVRGFEADQWQSVGGMLMTPWRGRARL